MLAASCRVIDVYCVCVFLFFFLLCCCFFFCCVFLMIRRPPRSTLDRSSAASDVYKRQRRRRPVRRTEARAHRPARRRERASPSSERRAWAAVSYTHLRAHETVLDLVCRLLLEKKQHKQMKRAYCVIHNICQPHHTTKRVEVVDISQY